jgi:signal peptidase I
VKKKTSASSSLLELIMIVAVALGLALGIQAFLVKPYRIPSPSMVPTLVEGQRILVNRLGNRFGDPEIGDVVVFRPPAGAEEPSPRCGADRPPEQVCSEPTAERADETYVKRLVAGPGDRIEIAADGSTFELRAVAVYEFNFINLYGTDVTAARAVEQANRENERLLLAILPPSIAERLVVEGFLAELVERFEEGPVREALAHALERRLEAVLG